MRFQRSAEVSRTMESTWFARAYEIEPDDLENAYHHVSHVRQLAYLEKGRLDFLRESGFDEEWWISRHILLVVTDVSVQYLREIKQTPLFVTVDNVRFEEKEIIATQRLFTSSRKLAASAEVRSACLHAERKRAIVPPELFVRAIAER